MDDLKLQIGLDVILSYRRLSYTPWYALAEFVDNSTQSYRDNRKVLDKAYAKEKSNLKVTISYDRNADLLIVHDNAMGMSYEDLQGALHIGKPPADDKWRSQYGLGLKTAACWFGDKWTVRTKKLGESTGTQVDIDVPEVAKGHSHKIPTTRFDAEKSEHYTEIRIEKLHLKLYGRRLGKTKESLSSMYRVDIRDELLEIVWDTSPLPWKDTWVYLDKPEGGEAKVKFEFTVGDRPSTGDEAEQVNEEHPDKPTATTFEPRTVRGWVGVLAPGSSSRGNAGFALIRRGRVIRGWPEGWRPEAIFGPSPGRNDLINQRITGEIHLDEFDVTHTKNDILWRENEEDEVQNGIKERCNDLLKLAREYRHQPPPPPQKQKLSLDAIVGDTDFGASAVAVGRAVRSMISELVPSDVAEVVSGSLARTVQGEPASLTLDVGEDSSIRLLTTSRLGPEVPYLTAQEIKDKLWVLVVNAVHPICAISDDLEALKIHMEHALADGLVMWALGTGRIVGGASSLLTFKDAVLRSMSKA